MKIMKISKRKLNNEENNKVVKKKRKSQNELLYSPDPNDVHYQKYFYLRTKKIIDQTKFHDESKNLVLEWFMAFKKQILSKNSSPSHLKYQKLLRKFKQQCNIQNLNDVESIKFSPPADLKIIGAFNYNTLLDSDVSLDLLLELPKDTFNKNDYKNARYLQKKVIYLSQIASVIKKELVKEIHITGSYLNPLLVIIPKIDMGKQIHVIVHSSVNIQTFDIEALNPEASNIDKNFCLYRDCDASSVSYEVSTPFYNNVIKKDLTISKNDKEFEKILNTNPMWADAIILLKLWLKNRGIDKSHSAFNGFTITVIVTFLLCTIEIKKSMNFYQIIHSIWSYLTNSSWCTEGLSLSSDMNSSNKLKNWRRFYDNIFLDWTGHHNMISNILTETLEWIKDQAKIALKIIEQPDGNEFEILFTQNIPTYLQFDHIICFNQLDFIADYKDHLDEKNIFQPIIIHYKIKTLLENLKVALNNRISGIHLFYNTFQNSPLNSISSLSTKKIYFGLNVDPQFCYNIIEKGPKANSEEAPNFQKFWGSKCELRRFKDGTIHETVDWTLEIGKDNIPGGNPCQSIVNFIMKKKYGRTNHEDFFQFPNELEYFSKTKEVKLSVINYTTKVRTLFNKIQEKLLSFNELPLQITCIQLISETFSISNTNVVEGIIKLSSSKHWPKDWDAKCKTRTAYYIHLSMLINYKTKFKAWAKYNCIDIMQDGFIFRFQILTDTAIGYNIMFNQTPENESKEEIYESEAHLFQKSQLRSHFDIIQKDYPAFRTSASIIKYWLSCHMIDDYHFPDLILETLMSFMFSNNTPYRISHSAEVIFCRFLDLLSRQIWITQPFIVNLHDEFKSEDIKEIKVFFTKNRPSLPALFISTPSDKYKSLMTKRSPEIVVLNRIASLATETLKLIAIGISSQKFHVYQTIFNGSTKIYDFLIHLRKINNVYVNRNNEHIAKNKQLEMLQYSRIGFSAIDAYLIELRKRYGEWAMFFYNQERCIIGVLLRENFKKTSNLRIRDTFGHEIDDSKCLHHNFKALKDDFYIYGQNIVERVEISK